MSEFGRQLYAKIGFETKSRRKQTNKCNKFEMNVGDDEKEETSHLFWGRKLGIVLQIYENLEHLKGTAMKVWKTHLETWKFFHTEKKSVLPEFAQQLEFQLRKIGKLSSENSSPRKRNYLFQL